MKGVAFWGFLSRRSAHATLFSKPKLRPDLAKDWLVDIFNLDLSLLARLGGLLSSAGSHCFHCSWSALYNDVWCHLLNDRKSRWHVLT